MSAFIVERSFSLEGAKCSRCSAILSRLDYVSDSLGRTLERCPVCGPHLMPIVRENLPEVEEFGPRQVFTPKPWRRNPELNPCACGTVLTWRGRGRKPVYCVACRKAVRKASQREYWTANGARSKARTRAKRAA